MSRTTKNTQIYPPKVAEQISEMLFGKTPAIKDALFSDILESDFVTASVYVTDSDGDQLEYVVVTRPWHLANFTRVITPSGTVLNATSVRVELNRMVVRDERGVVDTSPNIDFIYVLEH